MSPCSQVLRGLLTAPPNLPSTACVCSGSESQDRGCRLCQTGPGGAGGVGSAEDPLAPEPQDGRSLLSLAPGLGGRWQQKGSVHLQHCFSLRDHHGAGRCIKRMCIKAAKLNTRSPPWLCREFRHLSSPPACGMRQPAPAHLLSCSTCQVPTCPWPKTTLSSGNLSSPPNLWRYLFKIRHWHLSGDFLQRIVLKKTFNYLGCNASLCSDDLLREK